MKLKSLVGLELLIGASAPKKWVKAKSMKPILPTLILAGALAFASGAQAQKSALRVVCNGDDVGAEVSVNGKFKGECPIDIEVAPGTLKLRVEKKDPSYERVFEQEIRMGDGVAKKVEVVLSRRLNAAGQQREEQRLALEREKSAEREADEARKDAEVIAKLEANMVAIPGKNYAIGKFEVTQAEWSAFFIVEPGISSKCGDTCPIDRIDWDEAQEFISKLNTKTGKQYRLPTYAEWLFACFGGTPGTTYCGGNDADAVAWHKGNSNGQLHPVGQKRANGYGLYDMTGNVMELLDDCSKQQQPYTCRFRGQIGGAWAYLPVFMITTRELNYTRTDVGGDKNGFRLARTLP